MIGRICAGVVACLPVAGNAQSDWPSRFDALTAEFDLRVEAENVNDFAISHMHTAVLAGVAAGHGLTVDEFSARMLAGYAQTVAAFDVAAHDVFGSGRQLGTSGAWDWGAVPVRTVIAREGTDEAVAETCTWFFAFARSGEAFFNVIGHAGTTAAILENLPDDLGAVATGLGKPTCDRMPEPVS